MYHSVTELPASGWVEVYPMISKPNELLVSDIQIPEMDNSKIIWTFETQEKEGNYFYSKNAVSEDTLYSVTDYGVIYASYP